MELQAIEGQKMRSCGVGMWMMLACQAILLMFTFYGIMDTNISLSSSSTRRLSSDEKDLELKTNFFKMAESVKLTTEEKQRFTKILNIPSQEEPGAVIEHKISQQAAMNLLRDHDNNVPVGRRKRHIVIDLGTNDGSSLDFVFKSDKSGNTATQGGDVNSGLKGFGINGSFHIFAIEPNPKLTPILVKQKLQYEELKLAKSYTLLSQSAITTRDGPIRIYSDTPNADHSGAGLSLMNDSFSVQNNPTFTVTGIDVVTFMRDIVQAKMRDFIILKMDIEGHEFEVLQRMIGSGFIKYIDILAVEFHHRNHWVFSQNEVKRREFGKQYDCIQWVLQGSNVTSANWG